MKLLPIFFIFICQAVTAQNANPITGQWKIVSFEAGVYHSYKNDSTSIPTDLREGLAGDPDSLAVVDLAKEMISEFRGLVYIFGDDGQYTEKTAGKISDRGSYVVDSKEKSISMKGARGYGPVTRPKMMYERSNETLIFTIPDEDMEVSLSFERIL